MCVPKPWETSRQKRSVGTPVHFTEPDFGWHMDNARQNSR
jgi:hypothetical protein